MAYTAEELQAAIERSAERLEPALAQAYLRTVRALAAAVVMEELVRRLAAGDVDRAVALVLESAPAAVATTAVRQSLTEAITAAGRSLAKGLPAFRPLPRGPVVRVAFDVAHPATASAAQAYTQDAMTTLTDDMRAGLRRHVRDGLARGDGPRTIARRVRDIIGLAEGDVAVIETVRTKLLAGDASYFGYDLRDRRFDRQIRRRLDAGETLPADLVDRAADAYRRRRLAWRAEVHARTAALDTARLAQRSLWDQAVADGAARAEDLERTWHATGGHAGDGRTREQHRRMHGQTAPHRGVFRDPQGARVWRYVGDGEYNCLLPETRVQGTPLAVMRSWYSGEAIELVTRAEARLRVTPNHPVLTPAGFVAAGLLREGDRVLRHGVVGDRVADTANVDHEQVPPTIAEVFGALAPVGEQGRAAARAHDLHGDGRFVEGDIEIVGVDRELFGARDATGAQRRGDLALVGVGDRETGHPRLGDLDVELGRMRDATGRLVGAGDLPDARLRGHPAPLETLGVGASAHRDAPRVEGAPDHGALDAERDREGLLGLARDVALRDLALVDDVATECRRRLAVPEFDAALLEAVPEGAEGGVALAREAVERLPGLVTLDEVLEVHRTPYRGYVYDMMTLTGVIVAETVLVSNCRCVEFIKIKTSALRDRARAALLADQRRRDAERSAADRMVRRTERVAAARRRGRQ